MIAQSLTTIIIEDEEDTLSILTQLLSENEALDIIGTAAHIDEAYNLIVTQKPTVAFMDIKILGGDIFQLLERLKTNNTPIPYIVLISAFQEYSQTALNEYRNYVVQFINKPVLDNWETKSRNAIDALLSAVQKEESNPKENTSQSHIFLQTKGKFIKLVFEKITYIEVAGNGESTVFLLDGGQYQVNVTLSRFVGLLPYYFCRIHRSYIINTKYTLHINRYDRTVSIGRSEKPITIGISDTYYKTFTQKLNIIK